MSYLKKDCFLSSMSSIQKIDFFNLTGKTILYSFYNFDINYYKKELFEKFELAFPLEVKQSVLKRQAEYLAGRYAARSALSKLGINIDNIPIGKHRNPIWPDNISASISHTDNEVICVCSYKADCQYLGVDIEERLNIECINNIKTSIVDQKEECLLQNNELDFKDLFTLTFSAKESLFKALYPYVGSYFDFSAAKITFICKHSKKFTLTLAQDLSEKLISGLEFHGYFRIEKQIVITLIAQ